MNNYNDIVSTHCINCKYFETRTKFCRFNCPSAMTIIDNNKQYMTAVWPKIAKPESDWCSNFMDK